MMKEIITFIPRFILYTLFGIGVFYIQILIVLGIVIFFKWCKKGIVKVPEFRKHRKT
jgi:hypothetical protein